MGNQAGRLQALERVAPRPTPAVASPGSLSLDEMWRQALILCKSRLVPTALKDNPEGVMLVGMRGAELGWSFTTALDFIDVFEGRAVVNAQGGLAVIRRAGHRARFVHEECDATKAVIIGQRRGPDGWEPEERITWTIEEAQTAGLLDEWVERKVRHQGDQYDRKEKFILRREGDRYVPGKFGATTMPDWVTKAIADGQVKHKDNWWNYPGDQLKARAAARLRRNVFSDVMAAFGVDRYTAEEQGAQTAVSDLDETANTTVVHDDPQDDDITDAELLEQDAGPEIAGAPPGPAVDGAEQTAASAGDRETVPNRSAHEGGAGEQVVGTPVPAPGPQPVPGEWRARAVELGKSDALVLRMAQGIATELGLTVPNNLDQVTDPKLVTRLEEWLG